MLPDEESPVAEIDARDPAAAQNACYLFYQTRTKPPSTDEIAIIQRQLEDMVDILDFHNSIFRRMIYTGVLFLFCLAIYVIAIIERQLDNMLDNLNFYHFILRAGFCLGALLMLCMTMLIRARYKQNERHPRFY
jgi:hypothetical protein